MLRPDEIINVKSWMSLGDSNYEIDHDDDSIPESGVVYCNIEHIHKFFAKCENTDNEYIVVSGFSDYGFARQKEHPVWVDMKKTLTMMVFNQQLLEHYTANPTEEYQALQIAARCDYEKCNKEDEFSVKCYAYTYSTVPRIPSNVKKWFLVNSMTKHDSIQGIPLGVGKDAASQIYNVASEGIEKQEYVYANWQNHTLERSDLKNFLIQTNPSWCTIRHEAIGFEDYLRELARHMFVFCPEGNGIDCYRLLEAIYLGCTPIVKRSPTTEYLEDLPIMMVDSFYDVNLSMLKKYSNMVVSHLEPRNVDKAKLSYWKKRIEESRDLIK